VSEGWDDAELVGAVSDEDEDIGLDLDLDAEADDWTDDDEED
jgi:hypothetical protein